jgi:hypothetical protein
MGALAFQEGVTSMRMSEKTREDGTEHLRLLRELERLEEEQRALDLRDERALDECKRRIDALRRKIDLFVRRRKA